MKTKQKSKQNESEVGRRQFLKYAVGVAGVAALGGVYLLSDREREVTLEEARANPELRQAYLDRIVRSLEMPEVEFVQYDHDGSKTEAYKRKVYEELSIAPPYDLANQVKDLFNIGMGSVPFFKPIIGTKRKLPFFVYPHIFENKMVKKENGQMIVARSAYTLGPEDELISYLFATDIDFISSIRDHEYYHIKDSYHGFKIGNQVFDHSSLENTPMRLIEVLAECRAYNNFFLDDIKRKNKMGEYVSGYFSKRYAEEYENLLWFAKRNDIARSQLKELSVIPERSPDGNVQLQVFLK